MQIALTVIAIVVILALGALLGIYMAETKKYKKESVYYKKRLTAYRAYGKKAMREIRIPLNTIVGLEKIAKGRLDNKKEVSRCLEKIEMSAWYLNEVVNEMLYVEEMNSKTIMLDIKYFSMEEILAELCAETRVKAEDKGITFLANLPGKFPAALKGDYYRVRQILYSLFSNAVKFSYAGGTVEFTVEQNIEGEMAGYCFRVKDDGIGIVKERQQKIFQAFDRGIEGIDYSLEGNGLGLSIAKRLCDMMGGTIDVWSEEGKGSIFEVNVSFMIQQLEATQKEKEDETVSKDSLEGYKILVVEDNDLNREVAMTLLREMGATVEPAHDGSEAVHKIRFSEEGEFQVVLMDIRMPGMDGYEATKEIRGLNRNDVKEMQIIALSANVYSEEVQKSHEAGMNHHMPKPLNMKMLIRILTK